MKTHRTVLIRWGLAALLLVVVATPVRAASAATAETSASGTAAASAGGTALTDHVARAKPAAAPRIDPAAPYAGDTITLSGRLPAKTARPVVLQRRLPGDPWQAVTRGRTSARGDYEFSRVEADAVPLVEMRVRAKKARVKRGKKSHTMPAATTRPVAFAVRAVASELPVEYVPCGNLERDASWAADVVHVIDNCGHLGVPAGVTLTVAPGTVIKVLNTTVEVTGTLRATGTTERPVLITSSLDRSAPGRSDGEVSAEAAAGDWGGFRVVDGGIVEMQHFDVRFAARTFEAIRGRLHLTDGVIQTPRLEGARLEDAAPASTVTRVVFDNVPGESFPLLMEDMDVAFSSFEQNTASGSTSPVLGMKFASASGDEVFPTTGLRPVIIDGYTVTASTSLTVPAGARVAVYGGFLDVEGVLRVTGNQGEPAVFTSHARYEANAQQITTASPGDWGGVRITKGGEVDMDHAVMSFATLPFQVRDQGLLAFRGEISDSADAALRVDADAQAALRGRLARIGATPWVVGCPWFGEGRCSIDASLVDWGSPAGPVPPHGPALACGRVLVEDWVGMTDEHDALRTPQCDGGGSAPVLPALQTSFANAQSQLAAIHASCDENDSSTSSACDVYDRWQACFASLRDLAVAGSTFPIPTDASNVAEMFGSAVSEGLALIRDPFSGGDSKLGRALALWDAVQISRALSDAYDSCLGSL